jgi:Icc-related predicted phosphoesterase
MVCWCISDTHGRHRELKVPECDLIIFAGDESNSPKVNENEREAIDFFDWFSKIDIPKVFVPGNHSVAIFNNRIKDFGGSIVLKDAETDFNGLRIYGSPWTPTFGSQQWAYIRARGKMVDVWENVPSCDVLVTHSPPKGILDVAEDIGGKNHVHCGCRQLMNKIWDIGPRLHVFGHVHSHGDSHNAGIYHNYGTTFVNASVVDNQYNLINNGFLVEL